MTGAAPGTTIQFLSNPVFLSAVSSLLTAQLIKSIIVIVKSKPTRIREVMLTFFWKTGGMPSSHSALAVSITVAIALTEGFTSVFILSLFFALVVIRDALGVRRSAGLQARAINQIGKELASRLGMPFRPVREVHGHNPTEAVVGAALGFFLALAFCTL